METIEKLKVVEIEFIDNGVKRRKRMRMLSRTKKYIFETVIGRRFHVLTYQVL